MDGKQHSFVQMERNSRKQYSCAIGGLMFDVTYRRFYMKLTPVFIANRKWIQRSHIAQSQKSWLKIFSTEHFDDHGQ